MRLPNLNALRMFDAAARHLNFRLAAQELHVTQGAVAQQVRNLEAELGQPLFHRLPRSLSLTEVGQKLHPPVAHAMALLQAATQSLTPETHRLRLSVPPSFAAKWLIPRLRSFQSAHPEIDLHISADNALSTLGKTADMAVRQSLPPRDPALGTALLCPLNLYAVASPELAAEIGSVKNPQALLPHPLIQDGHRHWDRLLADATVRPRILHVNQTALAMDAAINGQGIALVPQLYLQSAEGCLTPLCTLPQQDETGFHILWALSPPPSTAQIKLRDWLLAQAQMQMQMQG
jgi:LysR family glycine cleavage system transcriptional activator